MSTQKQYGLIGYPLGHSFSQGFFTGKFMKENINAMYSNYEIEDIAMLDKILTTNTHLVGFNITIPHKQNILPLLNDISTEAKEIGAVNVVKVSRHDGNISLKGYNSDVFGFRESIKPLINKEQHKKALILGTGGASKAILYGLKQLGIETQLVSRTQGENTITYADLTKELINAYKVIVNCTPIGTFPNTDKAPDIPYEYLTNDHLIYDLVYNPAKTEFLKRAKSKGAVTKNGAEMLELQALEAWRIWNE